MKNLQKTIEAGALIDRMQALFIESADSLRNTDVVASVVSRYDPLRANAKSPWWAWVYEGWIAVSVEYWVLPDFRCVLSSEGGVNIYGPGGSPDYTFQISGAGVFGDAATGLGYVNRIRAIGAGLYVCGQSRQVYRFDWNGRDLAAGQWVDFAGPMRQPPMSEPPEDSNDTEAFDRWLDENDAIDFVDIAGSSESDIYAVGDEAWHWDGMQWRQLDLPTDEPLAAIKVMSADLIYIVGHNGTLLAGNARDGFRDQSTVDDNQNFTGVEWFGDRLFLASNFGMFTFDPATRKIERYATDLKPDLKDTHMLEAKDGILWSFGFKDLAWFDGSRWTRVDQRDNPPIR